ncbi:hypothetical protein D3C77_405440 [compost metagenome]
MVRFTSLPTVKRSAELFSVPVKISTYPFFGIAAFALTSFLTTLPSSIVTAIPPENPTLLPRAGVNMMLVLLPASGVRFINVAYHPLELPSGERTVPVMEMRSSSMMAVPSFLKPIVVPFPPLCIATLFAISVPYGSGGPPYASKKAPLIAASAPYLLMIAAKSSVLPTCPFARPTVTGVPFGMRTVCTVKLLFPTFTFFVSCLMVGR